MQSNPTRCSAVVGPRQQHKAVVAPPSRRISHVWGRWVLNNNFPFGSYAPTSLSHSPTHSFDQMVFCPGYIFTTLDLCSLKTHVLVDSVPKAWRRTALLLYRDHATYVAFRQHCPKCSRRSAVCCCCMCSTVGVCFSQERWKRAPHYVPRILLFPVLPFVPLFRRARPSGLYVPSSHF